MDEARVLRVHHGRGKMRLEVGGHHAQRLARCMVGNAGLDEHRPNRCDRCEAE